MTLNTAWCGVQEVRLLVSFLDDSVYEARKLGVICCVTPDFKRMGVPIRLSRSPDVKDQNSVLPGHSPKI